MTELSAYDFSTLRSGAFTLSRGHGIGVDPILLVAPAGDSPSRESLQRLEHEFALRTELDADWAARPVELLRHDAREMLVLEDRGGVPLEQLLGQPLEAAPFLRIAIPLTVALGQVHARGLIHKDVKPANVLVDAASGHVWLTGFGIASRLPREHQAPAPPEVIAGTLAYMAPEQTGRMNRSVDTRSDLYSLGISFFEMLTGTLPFTASDPMEWVHCHIARQPVSPSERASTVPAQLSAIVLKLLAKTAEERYQTAGGLASDLRRCLADWEAYGEIPPFALGTQDASDRLLIPETLYGREHEIDFLLSAFDRVVAQGTPELVLVSGYSGIGKSSVVNELQKVLVPSRGLFASGKFDQYRRDFPYATLAQAFRSLVRPILGQSDAELGRWRDALRDALGPHGQLIVNLVPELELVLGPQPPVPELAPQDAKNRFQMVFRRFVAVFARSEHPLILFLDDLQWLDAATLDLLEHLVTQPDVRHLLLVGAYRDNEVDSAHPLMRRLATIQSVGAPVHEIVLRPLTLDDVGRLVADTLHGDRTRAQPLARLVHERTGGNPFFAIQFFIGLAEEGLLAFDPVAPGWRWDMDRIAARSYTDNVVELMAGKLRRLSAPAQDALKHLACLGTISATPGLALLHETTPEAGHAALWEAAQAGLVHRTNGAYTFLHDRIQQAAYSLIPQDQRAAVHLRIGRALLSSMEADGVGEHLFEVVNQLDRGAALITAPDERERLAELDLMAGQRAMASTAYPSALTYLVAGSALLADDAWERRHDLAFALESSRAECEFLTGALGDAEQRLAALSSRAATTVERASVACLRADLYTTLDQGSRAIAVGLDYLRQLGIAWSPHPTEEEARSEYERIWSQLGSRAIEQLIDLPVMSDPVVLATLEVLTRMATPALYTDANLYLLVICRQVNLSLEHGNCDASCFAYEWLAMAAGARFGDHAAAYSFGRLGLDLVERRGLTRYEARTSLIFGGLVIPWTRHVRSGRDLLRRSFEAATRIGDLTYAAYACDQLITNLLAAGDPLVEVQRECENGLAFARKMRFGLVIDLISAELGLVRSLRGSTRTFGSFDDDELDEGEIEGRFAANPDLALAQCWYSIRKLQARFLAGDHGSALEAASTAQRLLWTSVSRFETAEYHFYAALSHAASWDSAAEGRRGEHSAALAAHLAQLEAWAANCPDNFENRAALVGAEIARIGGRDAEAMRLYETAIRSARRYGFVHNEGLALEVAAGFYAARGFEAFAQAYRRSARDCYRRWGAQGKVRQLEQLHPELVDAPAPAPAAALLGADVAQLDVGAVVKASQAISGEIVLGRLIETLMTIALENAGAERGLLILLRGGTPRIEAEARIDGTAVTVSAGQVAVTSNELPESLLHTVLRTRESVILDDASAANPFSADAYIRRTHARSVLCLPLMKQATLIGVLYLENTLASSVFTPERIAVLELLSSQAAISLENARLYADLLTENREREAAEDALRRSEAALVDAQQISHTGSWRWNTDSGEVTWSMELRRILAFAPTAPVLTAEEYMTMVHSDDRPAFQEALGRAVRGRHRFQHEYRMVLPDGSVRHLYSAGRPDVAESGELEYVGVVMDITERRRAEEALREAQGELERAARLTAMGELAASIAHEINQPLTAIVSNGAAGLRWLNRERPALDEVREALSHMISDGQRAAGVIRGIRAMAKKSVPQPTALDLDDAIQETLALTRSEVQRHGVLLRTKLSGRARPVMGDRVQLQQVLLNLILNGVDAMKAVTGRTRELAVSSSLADDGSLVVSVEDTGTGLDPAIAERIFEPFFTTKADGLGMGLSICRSIVEAHGGRLSMASRAPHGTTVQFTLP